MIILVTMQEAVPEAAPVGDHQEAAREAVNAEADLVVRKGTS